jgi:multidrug resistance efflux pump
MGKRVLIIVGIVAVVVAAVFVYQRMNDETNAEADAPETVVVRQDTLESTVGGTGSLGPVDEVSVSFASGGEVSEVLVEEGEQVVAGQPLAVLDTRDLRLALDSAEANLDSARSGLATAQTNLVSLEAGADEQDLAVAKVQIDQAKDKLWGSQAQRDGVCGRVEAGRGEDYECDSAEAGVLQAQDSIRIAELQYEQLLEGTSDEDLDTSRDKVTQAQAQVSSAEASVGQARLRLEQATLSSPIDGTVTALNATVGEMASTGQPAVTIGTLDELEVIISLDETDVASVAVGMDAVVVRWGCRRRRGVRGGARRLG